MVCPFGNTCLLAHILHHLPKHLLPVWYSNVQWSHRISWFLGNWTKITFFLASGGDTGPEVLHGSVCLLLVWHMTEGLCFPLKAVLSLQNDFSNHFLCILRKHPQAVWTVRFWENNALLCLSNRTSYHCRRTQHKVVIRDDVYQALHALKANSLPWQ